MVMWSHVSSSTPKSHTSIKEYSGLKSFYKWYKENRELKRRSAVLMQRVLSVSPSASLDQTDEMTDSRQMDDQIDLLNSQIQDLRGEVASLQAEINSLKLEEFEAQEQVADLTACLDQERASVAKLSRELEEERSKNRNLEEATRMAAQEVVSLREECRVQSSTADRLKADADQARKERNVLAHQSQVLLCEAAQDEKLMKALFEIETLKRNLEEQTTINRDLSAKYQEVMEMETQPHVELLEEKLKLLESELSISRERAARADNLVSSLTSKVKELEEAGLKVAPPPPPPPPPPPLPPLSTPRVVGSIPRGAASDSIVEVANLLGVTRPAKPQLHQGAIEELINEIKGGRFSLRTPERQKKNQVQEQPPALKEMMNVLGTLKRRPGNRVPSFKRPDRPAMKQTTGDITI